MLSAEIRSIYLKFFEERGHTIYPSASLVPENDPTLLFTGAGMNQFKDMFLGRGTLPFRRAATTQKCLRLPDLDEVGRTPSHHTFFEMLGNFSFGDYFKEEAIAWADELLCAGFGLDRSRLYVSVYEDDDEAVALWQKVGYPKDRIFRYGEKDNFWPSEAPSKGPNGPCGPCSEIYFDFGEHVAPELGSDPSSNGQRFVEVWNLVFTQYERRDGGALDPLPQRNIDTGMGFERLVRVLGGGATNFDTDLFEPILAALQERTGRPYGEDPAIDRPMRRVADHIRAVVFCIADGVVPSNERQGYVVRKIVRRALADGLDLLGLSGPFLADLAPVVIGVPGMKETFPELERHRSKVVQALRDEEQKFLEAYERGRTRLEEELKKIAQRGEKTLPGPVAFFLWDTAGFPVDLTRRVLGDRGLALDEAGFEAAMEEQRNRSRAGSKMRGEVFATGPLQELKRELAPTEFAGHDLDRLQAPVGAILKDGQRVEHCQEGDEVLLLFERSPFYAEAGGQVGDRGEFSSDSFRVHIKDTTKQDGYHLHLGHVLSGSLSTGEIGSLTVAPEHRAPTMRNHTATHLAHWALRRVLGPDVEQKGSLVDPDRLRFDFSYPGPVPRDKLEEVERLVNEEVVRNLAVSKAERSLDEALEAGAMALFGEKYGDRVRVVTVDDPDPERQSVELCGGTHVARTGDIGGFKIVAEGGIAAGVRRIEAVTGLRSLAIAQHQEAILRNLSQGLKVAPEQLADRVAALQEEVRSLKKAKGQAARSQAGELVDQVLESRREVGPVVVFCAHLKAGAGELMEVLDALKSRHRDGALCAVLFGEDKDGVPLVVSVDAGGREAGLHAGDLCRTGCGELGGGGGGNPGLGRGKGRRKDAVEPARERILEAIRCAVEGA